jgi:hypothetical protein
VHLVQELADFSEEHKDWLRVFQMPSYAPELNFTMRVRSVRSAATKLAIARRISDQTPSWDHAVNSLPGFPTPEQGLGKFKKRNQ